MGNKGFKDGTMTIAFVKQNFFAQGTTINGTLKIQMQKKFEAKSIVISLVGKTWH